MAPAKTKPAARAKAKPATQRKAPPKKPAAAKPKRAARPRAGGKVLTSVNQDLRDLAERDPALAGSALAATARQLARELDAAGNSATSKAACAKALMEALDRLRELAPKAKEKDQLDDLAKRRHARRGRAAAKG